MASLVLNGNTSGSVTISSPAVSGTTTLTLPTTSGTVLTKDTNGIASVNGVQFPATQSASADANCLDDYEEGTFTPVPTSQSGSITSYSSTGSYVKVGKIVNVIIGMTITTPGTASGTLFFTVPFANINSPYPTAIVREYNNTGTAYQAQLNASAASGTIWTFTNGGVSWTSLNNYSFALTYQTSS